MHDPPGSPEAPDDVWPDALTTLAEQTPRPRCLLPDVLATESADPRLAGQPPRDPDEPRWAHVDPDHPAPWLGCVRRGLCCRSNPGWFAPGEAEAAAAALDLEMAELVNGWLVIDHVDTSIGRIEAFAPAKLGPDGLPVEPPGAQTSELYSYSSGVCVFFDGMGCRIYAARPLECRWYDCTSLPEDRPPRLELARLWLDAASDQDDRSE